MECGIRRGFGFGFMGMRALAPESWGPFRSGEIVSKPIRRHDVELELYEVNGGLFSNGAVSGVMPISDVQINQS